MTSRRCLAPLFAALVLPVLGCRPAPERTGTASEAPDAAHPGPLLDPNLLGPDFQWRQRVTAQWTDEKARSFDAVLSKTDGELLLLGLSPMGMPGFVLRLRPGAVEFENHSPERLPFDPHYIMIDVERVFFPWIPGEPPHDGERSHDAHGSRIAERWRAGRLEERTFRSLAKPDEAPIVVTYEGWDADAMAPRIARLRHGTYGYRLTIETLEQQRL